VFHRYLPPNAAKATESAPGGLRRRTWRSSRCYENPSCVERSSRLPSAGHTCPALLKQQEPELHTLKSKLDIRCIWFLKTYCGVNESPRAARRTKRRRPPGFPRRPLSIPCEDDSVPPTCSLSGSWARGP